MLKPADPAMFKTLSANPCKGCRALMEYTPFQKKGLSCVGWCRNTNNDTESGFIFAHHLPPCLVWKYKA